MPILKLETLSLHFGEQIILDNAELQLEKGDRLCIVGRNGTGKSTLLKLIQGFQDPDDGAVWLEDGVKISSLSQELPTPEAVSLRRFVARGLGPVGELLLQYEALAEVANEQSLAEMEVIQAEIERLDGWRQRNAIETVLTRLKLPGELSLQDLSGGWRRRAALAQALVSDPDILLLDEPTNHLDVVAIEWLEGVLQQFAGAVIFITHDRAFLRRVANRIAELDRGQLVVWEGNYEGFLAFREQRLADEEKHNALFDKRLAEEERWIRQGIKARRTRNEGRVRALKKMRAERAERIQVQGNAKMAMTRSQGSGKLVAVCEAMQFSWADGTQVIRPFDCTIVRGDKIGLIGPNGIGKSTFLKLVLGELSPTNGKVTLGTQLKVAYFDQLRAALDLNKSAVDNVSEGRDFIEINGAQKHVIGYLGEFLFTGERARTPLRVLSGGERNRVLLAMLFSKPFNFLVMDEPTNDLDAETLELLEDLLATFEGTLVIVSHDRAFLDNVVTSTIAFEGDGVLREYVGGYEDWLRQGGHWPDQPLRAEDKGEPTADKAPANDAEASNTAPSEGRASKPPVKKLSYKLQRELDKLPSEIEALETAIEQRHAEMAHPEFYQQSPEVVAKHTREVAEQEAQLQELYARWEDLDSL